MTEKKSCGDIFRAVLAEVKPDDLDSFSLGIIFGQAEKVYLGACPAAMFKPAAEDFENVLAMVHNIAGRFGLQQRVISYQLPAVKDAAAFSSGQNLSAESAAQKATGPSVREIWIFKPQTGFEFGRWIHQPVNSPVWHARRAAECGIPAVDVDQWFHERQQKQPEKFEPYRQKCERCGIAIDPRGHGFKGGKTLCLTCMLPVPGEGVATEPEAKLKFVEAGGPIEFLEGTIRTMIAEGWVHRKGMVLGKAGPVEIAQNLRWEATELQDEIFIHENSGRPKIDAILQELGDVLGVVIHLALYYRFTLQDVARQELQKLPQRFTKPGAAK